VERKGKSTNLKRDGKICLPKHRKKSKCFVCGNYGLLARVCRERQSERDTYKREYFIARHHKKDVESLGVDIG
jgi:hypothetical protein